MTYQPSNLHLLTQAGNRNNIWLYEWTDDAATVAGAGYISDAYDRGMLAGDVVFVKQFTTSAMTAMSALTMHTVSAVSSTSGATLGSAITGGTVILNGTGASNPTVNDDTGDAYAAGSTFTNTTTGDVFIAIDVTSGAAVWVPVKTKAVLQAGKVSAVGTTAEVYRWRAPFKGKIVGASAILNGALTTGDGSVTLAIAGTGVTDGVITLTQSGSAAGSKFTATPSALNTFNAGDTITATVGGSNDAAVTANLDVLIEQVM